TTPPSWSRAWSGPTCATCAVSPAARPRRNGRCRTGARPAPCCAAGAERRAVAKAMRAGAPGVPRLRAPSKTGAIRAAATAGAIGVRRPGLRSLSRIRMPAPRVPGACIPDAVLAPGLLHAAGQGQELDPDLQFVADVRQLLHQ